MADRGRPTVYTPEIAQIICERMAEGESLASICRTDGFPARSTVRGWALDDVHGFYAPYARARALQAQALAEGIIDVADDGTNDWMASNDPENPGYRANGEHIQRSRLRVDAAKWLASKILPKEYGDKITQEHTGPDGGAIQIEDARKPIEDLIAMAGKVSK